MALKEKVPELAGWGFTSVWLPPFCDSLAPQGQVSGVWWALKCTSGFLADLMMDFTKLVLYSTKSQLCVI